MGPYFGGQPGVGDTEELLDCGMIPCPGKEHCVCVCVGGGQQYRQCVGPYFGGQPCVGDTEELVYCGMIPCPDKEHSVCVCGGGGEGVVWSVCGAVSVWGRTLGVSHVWGILKNWCIVA